MKPVAVFTLKEAEIAVRTCKPARKKTVRYRQRDRLQHRFVRFLPVEDRNKFERFLNSWFKL